MTEMTERQWSDTVLDLAATLGWNATMSRVPKGVYEHRVRPLAGRFALGVRKMPRSCWIWTARRNVRTGYGVMAIKRDGIWTTEYAHRVSYFLAHGNWPSEVDHLCRRRECVNPAHLEDVTHRVNALRGNAPNILRHRLGVCAQGHPSATEAVFRKGTRLVVYCKACRREKRARNH